MSLQVDSYSFILLRRYCFWEFENLVFELVLFFG